jgi:hypothetical protein
MLYHRSHNASLFALDCFSDRVSFFLPRADPGPWIFLTYASQVAGITDMNLLSTPVLPKLWSTSESLRGLIKALMVRPSPGVSESEGWRWLEMCISF